MVQRKNDSTCNILSHHHVSEKLDESEHLDDVKLVTEILQNGKNKIAVHLSVHSSMLVSNHFKLVLVCF